MEKSLSPMMKQYLRIKEGYKDCILFFRLGDFYEMFFDDALEGSKLLNLFLTKRGDVPMCGVPYHASKEYIRKLVSFDRKVAICEQQSSPIPGQIVERGVVEVISPGVIIDEDFLEEDTNNYLVAISDYKDYYSFSYIDLSTSNLGIIFYKNSSLENIKKDIEKYSPREIIVSEDFYYANSSKLELNRFLINKVPYWHLNTELAIKSIKEHFNVLKLSSLGFDENKPYYVSIYLIINYIKNNLKNLLNNIDSIHIKNESLYMLIDDVAQINLELIRNNKDLSSKYSLYSVLNNCKTAAGKRLLKEFILNPLVDVQEINARLSHVDFLYNNIKMVNGVREALSESFDIERIISRVQMKKYQKKNFLFILNSIYSLFSLNSLFKDHKFMYWVFSPSEENTINKIYSLLGTSISKREDEVIAKGYSKELDHLRDIKNNVTKYLETYETEERKITSINTLKVKRNNIHGTFIEITKSNYGLVPEYFKEKQSLASSKRYTTDKLISIERDVVNAEENFNILEKSLFDSVAEQITAENAIIKKIARFLSYIDIISNFALIAKQNGYTKPLLTNQKEIILKKSRHPVVEHYSPKGEVFYKNPVNLTQDKYFFLVTGPNMAGKSTYLRQVALITLMAHIGSFVPADSAKIGITDKIFCRIGASDNISRGESTFLVEMNETASILRNATENSLIIMDEVGRGTSTNDGLAIAFSIVDYILNKIKARSLFATHFHELSSISHDSFLNLSMKIEKQRDKLVFLRQVEEQPSLNSYGIYVASLAGIPLEVIKRADKILRVLVEREKLDLSKFFESSSDLENRNIEEHDEILFKYEEIRNLVAKLDINDLTPFHAMNILNDIIKKVR